MSIFREIKIKLAEYLMNNAHEQPITHTDSVEITEITHLWQKFRESNGFTK